MSLDDQSPVPSSTDRREALREKAQQVQARQSRTRWAKRSVVTLVALAVVGAVAVGVSWTVISTVNKPQLSPQNTTDDGFPITAIAVPAAAPGVPASEEEADQLAATNTEADAAKGEAAKMVDIDVYVDYLSEGSREWQLANAEQLTSWVNEGIASLNYHPVSMLAAKSNGTKYSLRAAGAVACVATHANEDFYGYSTELLVRQPEVDDDGFTDVELVEIAQALGVDAVDKVRPCIVDGVFQSWVKVATERAVATLPGTDGLTLTGTPMILVNGQAYVGSLSDPAEFSSFVLTTSSGVQQATETPAP